MNDGIKIPADVQARINQTVRQQQQDDKIGLTAATTATPGPLRDVWAAVPGITVGPFSVRRFTDRDFIWLAQLGHPLKSFSAVVDKSYDFNPSGEHAHQLCWLLATSKEDVKAAFKQGVDVAKEAAASVVGDLDIHGIGALMGAVVKQLTVYSSTHLEYEPANPKGDEHSGPPSLPS